MKCGRRNMIRVLNYFLEYVKLLENFVSLKHPQTCVKCKYD